jgi:hypothetical protein
VSSEISGALVYMPDVGQLAQTIVLAVPGYTSLILSVARAAAEATGTSLSNLSTPGRGLHPPTAVWTVWDLQFLRRTTSGRVRRALHLTQIGSWSVRWSELAEVPLRLSGEWRARQHPCRRSGLKRLRYAPVGRPGKFLPPSVKPPLVELTSALKRDSV